MKNDFMCGCMHAGRQACMQGCSIANTHMQTHMHPHMHSPMLTPAAHMHANTYPHIHTYAKPNQSGTTRTKGATDPMRVHTPTPFPLRLW